jgi:hypothetical protein
MPRAPASRSRDDDGTNGRGPTNHDPQPTSTDRRHLERERGNDREQTHTVGRTLGARSSHTRPDQTTLSLHRSRLTRMRVHELGEIITDAIDDRLVGHTRLRLRRRQRLASNFASRRNASGTCGHDDDGEDGRSGRHRLFARVRSCFESSVRLNATTVNSTPNRHATFGQPKEDDELSTVR